MNKEELIENWKPYCIAFREIEGRGLCAIYRFVFTYGIVVDLDEMSWHGRWCFESSTEAIASFKVWDGIGDPLGMWVKYKGRDNEYSNIHRPDFNADLDKPSPHVSSKQEST